MTYNEFASSYSSLKSSLLAGDIDEDEYQGAVEVLVEEYAASEEA